MLRRIDRILIRVPQLSGAVTYYRDVLGMKVIREDQRLAALRLPDDVTELVLHVDPDLPAEGIYFLVDDVREMYRRRQELKLTFLGPPAQVARGFTAAVKDPFGTILQLLDRTNEGASKVEDATPGATLFAGIEARVEPKRQVLIRLYEKIGRTADDLPYTPHFEQLYEPYIAVHPDPKPSRAEVWRHLLNLRKGGKLPKLGEARSKPPALEDETLGRLKALLGKELGKRDRLPYTERFDELVDSFNKTLPRPLSPHLIWRAVATLAKQDVVMAKRTSVEDELAALKTLAADASNPELDTKLRQALASRTNLIAARATAIVLRHKRSRLLDALIVAFDRFLNDNRYTDKGCTALTAIAKALYEIGDPIAEPVFLAGVKHVQMEGSFGPPVDVATELRGTCGLGLVRIGYRDAMIHLVDLLADTEPQVRILAARGFAYSERPEAALLLRFKLHTGDQEVEVITECMNALVRLDPKKAPALLAEFLEDSNPEMRMSAALALGETRTAEALELLKQRCPMERDEDARRTILLATGLLRLPQAIEWLISRVSDGSIQDAGWAIEALALYRRDPSIADRVRQAAIERKDASLERVLAKHFPNP